MSRLLLIYRENIKCFNSVNICNSSISFNSKNGISPKNINMSVKNLKVIYSNVYCSSLDKSLDKKSELKEIINNKNPDIAFTEIFPYSHILCLKMKK